MPTRTRLSEASGRRAAAVTPSDSAVIAQTRGLYIGGTGDLTVRMAGDDSVVTFVGVPGGTLLPISVDQVRTTGTTATDIVTIR